MAGGQFPAPAGADRQLFEKHMAPWIGRFFADLERAEGADFYRRVGTLGRVFIEIESEAFALAELMPPRLGRIKSSRRTGDETTEPKPSLARRNFLRALGAGAGVAVTPAALVAEAKRTPKATMKSARPATRPNSADVKTYYRVNRYPS